MKRGLSVNVVHPGLSRRATALVLHDRMQTASFAIVGARIREIGARTDEPHWEHLAYPTPPRNALAGARPVTPSADGPVVAAGVLKAWFDTSVGLQWSRLGVSGLDGRLSCAPGSVFEVSVDGQTLPAEDWRVEKTESDGAGRRFLLRNENANSRRPRRHWFCAKATGGGSSAPTRSG